MTHSSGVDGGSSTLTGLPLTVNEIKDASLFRPDQNVKGFCVKTEHHILQKDFLTREQNASDWAKRLSVGNEFVATQCAQAEETILIWPLPQGTKFRYRK
jgi:hypothetical protein